MHKFHQAPLPTGEGVNWAPGIDLPIRGVLPGALIPKPLLDAGHEERDYHVNIFDLWIAGHRDRYAAIKDGVENGLFIIRKEREVYVQTHGCWRILLEWTSRWYVPASPTSGMWHHFENGGE